MIRKTPVCNNVYEFEFKFPDPSWSSGLYPGGDVKIHLNDEDGNQICRSYTPISSLKHTGSFIFAIKIYNKTKEYP